MGQKIPPAVCGCRARSCDGDLLDLATVAVNADRDQLQAVGIRIEEEPLNRLTTDAAVPQHLNDLVLGRHAEPIRLDDHVLRHRAR